MVVDSDLDLGLKSHPGGMGTTEKYVEQAPNAIEVVRIVSW